MTATSILGGFRLRYYNMLSKQLWQAVAAFGTVIHCIDVSRTRDPDGFLCPTVTISSGPVVGTRVGLPSSLAIVDQFLGVPFAQSPPKRFEPPQPAEAWVKPLAAKTVKPACIQQFACTEKLASSPSRKRQLE